MEKVLAEQVGEKIREYRKAKKLTQQELARRLGRSVSRISEYESGKAAPRQDTLFSLAKILECSVDDFFPASSSTKMDDVLKLNTENFSFTDIAFLKQLIDYTENLKQDDRQKLLDDINSVVERFRKRR